MTDETANAAAPGDEEMELAAPPAPPESAAPPLPTPDERTMGPAAKLAWGVISLLVLAAGGLAAKYFIDTGPKPKQRPPRQSGTLVKVMPMAPSSQRVVVPAMGTVVPARRIVLQPRVTGEIVEISSALIPGGLLKAGQAVLKIDPTDYELAIKRLDGEVARAELALQLELGQQAIARSEYDLLSETRPIASPDRDLILRVPHLATAKSVLAAAKAAKAKGELDLARTTISAPFNATVLEKYVDKGTQVTPASRLAAITGTDEYWLRVSVPISRLKWLTIPKTGSSKGSAVRVFDDTGWAPGAYRAGHVTRLLGQIETEGRMARVLVTVPDPLALGPDKAGKPAMLIGTLLRVEIDGAELDGVYAIPRTALRDGSKVWVLDEDNTLDIRTVEVAWRDRERVLVRSGLGAGDRLITSDLAAPVEKMPLKVHRPKSQPSSRPQTEPAVKP